MTNEDKIRSMSTEELAKFLMTFDIDNIGCEGICPDLGLGCAFRCTHSKGEFLIKWLKEQTEC